LTSSRADHAREFGRAAALYARLRPSYPKTLFDSLDRSLEGPRAHAVDLGAGAGQATVALATMFERVTAIESDARMIAEIPASPRIDRCVAAAEQASFPPSSVDAIVAATSFHWMDQDLIVARAFDWLRPGGAFFPFMYGVFEFEGAARAIFEREAPHWAAYKDDRLLAKYDPGPAIASSGLFASVAPVSAIGERTYAPDDAAALLATTSYGAAYAADHGGTESYLRKLAQDFAAAADEIVIRFPISGVIALKARG